MKVKYYYFIDKIDRKEIENLPTKISIIYRNYVDKKKDRDLTLLINVCKKKRQKVYIADDLKTAIRYNFDGLYIPSFNNNIIHKNLSKKIDIIGSAHSISQLKRKEDQGCKEIFISPIFKSKKRYSSLGIIKFNLITLNAKRKIVCLGGINEENKKLVRMSNCFGIAAISWIKKNGPSINTGPF
tara:strand:- start:128 stop:679 length:552 start_codon:yes stop_codon:yes gene_type:complete